VNYGVRMHQVEVPALDRLELLVVMDNETDTLSSVDPAIDQAPELASLMGRIEPSGEHDGHPVVCVFDHLCVACHGLSVLVTGQVGDSARTVLFDVGPYADAWLDNAHRLDFDLSAIETVFLSHWHADHSGGFPEVIAAIAAARSEAGLPAPIVDLHPDRPDQRGVRLPTGALACLPDEPTFEAIEAAGGVIERRGDVHAVAGLFVGSGLIERQTSYETGLAGHHTRIGDEWSEDPLILDERFFAARVRGRGVSVLSACSHAGIVNACLGAQALFPDEPVDTVLGGYHLAGGLMEPRIDETVRDLQAIAPRIVAPGHCTGWRAKAALAAAFSPGQYGPSVVGSRYILHAE